MKSLFSYPRFALPRMGRVAVMVGLIIGINPLAAQPSADNADTAVQIQVTELGLMRSLLLLDQSAREAEDRIAERLTEVDFRLVPAAQYVDGRMTPQRMREYAAAEEADLVLYAKTKTRELSRMQDFRIYEGEATTQIWIATTGELIASNTTRAKGPRSTDAYAAERNAVERSIDAATSAAIDDSLAKAHKILAHEAVLVNVFSDSALLAIMEYVGKMDGVYHVRRKSFDRQTNEALIEIIGAPHSETFWRAYLEKLPKTKVNFRLNPNDEIRTKYPSWFLSSGDGANLQN